MKSGDEKTEANMGYKTGFKDLSDAEERKFFEALGMSKEQLNDGMKPPRQFAYGWPRFQARVDTWISVYQRYAKSLDIQEKASLHRSINRLFFSIKEGKFVSKSDHHANRDKFKKKYIIPESMKGGHEARIWLKLAGAYTQALINKNRGELKRQRIVLFETQMPIEWMNIEEAGYQDSVQKRAFAKFVEALSDHWHLFIDSYRNEVHGVVINNSPHAASLQSFLKGSYPDGRPLRRPHSLVYWPMPLSHYAAHHNARALFEAKKNEIEALKPTLSSGKGSEIETIYSFPRWLRLGVDGVDPIPRPPQWKPKPRK